MYRNSCYCFTITKLDPIDSFNTTMLIIFNEMIIQFGKFRKEL